MDLADIIKTNRKKMGYKLEELSKLVGVSRATVSRWESGIIKDIKRDKIEKLSNILNIDVGLLMGWDESKNVNNKILFESQQEKTVHRIPVLGRVAAGLPLYADEHIIGYTYTERNGGAEYFGLLVSGDSMNATAILDGSIVIVRKQDNVYNGQIAVVLVDGEEATVKRFYKQGNNITLMPQSTNPAHQLQVYNLRDIDIRIIGKVVEVKNDIE